MRIIDPGHAYALDYLDVPEGDKTGQLLVFVKRIGEKYPGNTFGHAGTTIQEVLRALIDRIKYVQNQIPCAQNESAVACLRQAMWELETRAAIRHGRFPLQTWFEIELRPTCPKCFHIGCGGGCHP